MSNLRSQEGTHNYIENPGSTVAHFPTIYPAWCGAHRQERADRQRRIVGPKGAGSHSLAKVEVPRGASPDTLRRSSMLGLRFEANRPSGFTQRAANGF